MDAKLGTTVLNLVNPAWLLGPVVERDLRVSSRRVRNYVLRFAYVVLLSVFVLVTWVSSVYMGGSAASQASQMAEAGKAIITTILWFQFITIPPLAVIMLSTAINNEIYHKTLGVLMTTPISSVHIVLGKLLGKMLQLLLLLAISLPILAIVRVFGGVPLEYVVSSLCITLTTALFAGSISLTLSIYNRHAYSVIVRTVLICFVLYAVAAWVLYGLRALLDSPLEPAKILPYVNPYYCMAVNTSRMISPTAGGGAGSVWAAHCWIMLACSVVLCTFSTLSVRRVAMRQAAGQGGVFATWKERRTHNKKRAQQSDSAAVLESTRKTRPVKGSPVVWKELTVALVRGGRLSSRIAVVLGGVILISFYIFLYYIDALGERETQIAFVAIYVFLGLFRTSTAAATSITSEREAQTWPILLLSGLDRREIAVGKIIGSCLRGRAVWIVLGLHLIVLTLLRYIHPVALIVVPVVAAGGSLLVSAMGVMFSSICRRSSTAATINLILFLAFTAPVCIPLPTMLLSPVLIAGGIMSIAGGSAAARTSLLSLDYMFLEGAGGFFVSALALTGVVTIYLFLAGICLAIAKSNVRRKAY